MPLDDYDLVHNPAVALALIMVSVAGFLTTLVNLRNARLWLLLIMGRHASGVVTNMEIRTGSNGEVLRRPIVTFSTEDGTEVVESPAPYRKSTRLSKGSTVRLRYARRRPTRIVVHGYDFRLREPVYAASGLVIVFVIGAAYFGLW